MIIEITPQKKFILWAINNTPIPGRDKSASSLIVNDDLKKFLMTVEAGMDLSQSVIDKVKVMHDNYCHRSGQDPNLDSVWFMSRALLALLQERPNVRLVSSIIIYACCWLVEAKEKDYVELLALHDNKIKEMGLDESNQHKPDATS